MVVTTAERATVGLKELRQDASEIVRRVEGGQQIDITVSGRLAARMVPPAPRRWLRWQDIADLFDGRSDPDWQKDRDLIDQAARRSLGSGTSIVMKAVLDTSVVIATDLAPLEGELAISAVTLAELHFGVLVTADPAIRAERLRRLSELQRTFDALPVDEDVATSYGELAAAVTTSGRKARTGSWTC